MGIKIGIVGFGEFSAKFMHLFLSHPDIDEVVGAEIMPERREEIKQRFGLKRIYESFEQMLELADDVNSVAIFTQRHQHGPMVIKALEAGKHVYSCVPLCCDVDEAFKIIELVNKTRLTYMVGETCYYFPCAIWCREKFKTGAFGNFVYGESQYYHDISEFLYSFKGSGGNDWKKIAGVPPMYYSTHSMAMLFSAIDDYPVEVTCVGYEDTVGDGFYGKGVNHWDNPFSNESAFLKMSKGGIARINEFRRCGTNKPSSFISSLIGTRANYMCNGMHHTFTTGAVYGQESKVDYVSSEINSRRYTEHKNEIDMVHDPIDYKMHVGYSPIHDISRLPVEWRKFDGVEHNGSHVFLVDDFVRAVISGKLPPNHVWDAAKYTIPGIIAHDSAMQGGKTLKIPYIGEAPSDWERLDYKDRIYE
ncbi:MAG: Gfo/Idh/MocA family oxidoreductase [Clostridia bacterium]|nr:Gfo/Idh/MocA family oxidoreductase [Clostridia bacterium]